MSVATPSANFSDLAIIVPARLASTRFPRKLLAPVRGKPLILYTAEQLSRELPAAALHFAVAEEELADLLTEAGYQTHLTDPALPSGTDRVAAANEVIQARYVLNVQPDEPLVTAEHLRALAGLLHQGFPMATLSRPLRDPAELADPNVVKVVTANDQRALYFSRAPIPFARDAAGTPEAETLAAMRVEGHLGLYGYEASFLKQLTSLPPGHLEQIEKLEQLRVLENGHPIAVASVDAPMIGIDTPEDLRNLLAYLN